MVCDRGGGSLYVQTPIEVRSIYYFFEWYFWSGIGVSRTSRFVEEKTLWKERSAIAV
ncbi:hypothetical protein IQ235_10090 [Oscillatoriales cyanobacterium LEGE 11467]|uniref:Uncharacterized protein n=1 Tax=Zarconia navalis LEGE 11467 TaxID=1828826 RepID=A0A928VVR0_9CYAN|nr:hypothetical protein [Zarconia navalis]MBE9041127.1 hypothetical protein [Zarconia navalis LEGE 11467]